MPRKSHTAEQIFGKLREAEVLLSQRQNAGEARRSLNSSEQTYDRWRKEYGGFRADQAHRLMELDQDTLIDQPPDRYRSLS